MRLTTKNHVQIGIALLAAAILIGVLALAAHAERLISDGSSQDTIAEATTTPAVEGAPYRPLYAQLDPATVPDPPVDWAPETGAAAELPGPNEAPAAAEANSPPVDGSNDDLKMKLEEIKAAYTAYKEREGDAQSAVYLAGILASIVWFLLAVAKRVSSSTDRWKKQIPYIVLGLSAVGGVLSKFAGGMPWYSAVVVGLGPALSIVIHELLPGGESTG